MIIAEYRKKITESLLPLTDSARLDAEIILMCALNKTRTQLITDATTALSLAEIEAIEALLKRRLSGEPIAYILGSQPFWTMDLIVTPDTLIPRPETECLIDWILTHYKDHAELLIADLGTGSGAISLALAIEKPQWKIDAVDESYEALAIAQKNAKKYQLKNISFYPGDWCDGLPSKKYDVIVSNPPYIAENDIHLTKLSFEPKTALVSGVDGLDAIKLIATQARAYLTSGGVIVIEHGYDQAEKVSAILEKLQYREIQNHRDLADVPRFVTAVI